MRTMYIAEDNAQNYIIIRDLTRGENDTAVVDWDLSDDEIRNATPDEYTPEEWKPFDEIIGNMNAYQTFESWIENNEE